MAVSPMHSGMSGIQQGVKGLKNAAHDVASANVSAASEHSGEGQVGRQDARERPTEVEAYASLQLYKRQVQASAVVVETADQVLGFLLDQTV